MKARPAIEAVAAVAAGDLEAVADPSLTESVPLLSLVCCLWSHANARGESGSALGRLWHVDSRVTR